MHGLKVLRKKPAFRSLLKRNRILIPSNGFYDWRKEADGKQPYRFQMKSKEVYAFAGLYDTWRDPNGESISTCTIITTTPNKLVSDVHDRMPVILKDINGWLNPDTEDILQFLQPFSAEDMMKYPVSRDVGNVKNSD